MKTKASTLKSAALAWLWLSLASLGMTSEAQAQATTSVTRTVTLEYDAYGEVSRETVEPDDPALRVVTDYGRDTSYGVVTSRTRSWRDPATGADQSRVIETLGYDTRMRFATTLTNAKSQSETRSHDEGTGALLTLTGPNQLSTTWQYDGWGRKTRQSEADGTASTWAYRQCVDSCQTSAGGTAVSVVVTQSWSGSAQTQVPTEAFSDTLGRDIQTRSWSFDGRAVLTERAYDSLGRLAQTAPARFTGSAAVWTYQDHDDLGRVTRVRQPNAAGSGYDESLTTYNGLAVTRTNPKNQSRTEVSNGLGKLKSVTDAAGKTTSYLYDPWGNLARTSDPAGNQIRIGYDRLGRKTQLADPDLGTWTYSVDPLGQTWRQLDAKGQITRYDFDELGRMTHRLEADLESYWVYDTASRGIGKLAEAYTWVNGARDYQRLHSYDAYGRAATTTIRLDWDYVQEWGYDGFGRPSSTTYRRNAKGGSGGPAHTLTTGYNAQGYAAQLTRGSTVLWTAQAQDAQGRVTQAQLGNGLIRRRGYNAYTGRLESIAAGPDAGSASHQDDRYSYDAVGNLLSRSQLAATSGALMSETFGYDSLNRLASSQVSGQAAKGYGYDALGNLTSQGSLTYSYPPSGAGSVRPHAAGGITGSVAGLSNPGFSYDTNGNLAEGLGRRYGWTSFNQAGTIDKLSGSTATQRTAFIFDPEHQRIRQTVSPMSAGVPGAATRTVYYGPGLEKEIDSTAGTTTIRTYLPGGLGYLEEKLSGTAVDATASATAAERYFLNDRLGSPIAVVDASRTVLQRLSHDPWGRRRNADGSDDASATLGSIVNGQDHTGYTGHEQLDQLALVHMNGRIYDPITARMLSADPTVPDPSDTQSLNRYSYVLNNPFAYVDPSGYAGVGAEDQHVQDATTMQVGVLPRVVILGSNQTLIGAGTLFATGMLRPDRFLRIVGVMPEVGRVLGGMALRSGARAGTIALIGAGNPVNDTAAVLALVGLTAYECWQLCGKLVDIVTAAAAADQGQSGGAALNADGEAAGASAPEAAASGASATAASEPDAPAPVASGASAASPTPPGGNNDDKTDKQKKGKPQRNVDQNKQVDDAARDAKLSPQQRKELGRAIEYESRGHGGNLGYKDIREIAELIKKGQY